MYYLSVLEANYPRQKLQQGGFILSSLVPALQMVFPMGLGLFLGH